MRRPHWVDLTLFAVASAVVLGLVLTHLDHRVDWSPLSVFALASVPLLIRFGMVVESTAGTLRVSTAPAALFVYALDESLVFVPWWSAVVLLSHLTFFGIQRGTGRGGAEVLGGVGMVWAAREVDLGLWPLDRALVATVVYALIVIGLELIRGGVHRPGRILDGVRREHAALVFGVLFLACTVVAMLRAAYNDTLLAVTSLLGAGCLLAFVAAQVLLARLQAQARGEQALTGAAQAMPWPAGQIDDMLVRFVTTAVRVRSARVQPEAGAPHQVSLPLEDRGHLVLERAQGDLPFSRSERRLLRSLAGLADTSRQQALQREHLRYQATTDELTGLHTHAHFRFRVEQRIAPLREHLAITVVFLDLDGFKLLNSTIGHLDSNVVLETLGERFRTRLPTGLEMCRFAGDEFIFLATHPPGEPPESLVTRIRGLAEEPMSVAERVVQVKATLGMATSVDRRDPLDAVLRRAEAEMREAKSSRRAPQTAHRGEVVARLLEDSACAVVLQPMVDTTTGEIAGVEALLRVADRTFGSLSPLLVVDAAQRSDLLDDLTEVVARDAIAAARRIDALLDRTVTMAVNIELEQLRDDNPLLDVVIELAGESGVSLALEVSERSVEPWTDEHRRAAERLRAAGISLMLDDFGAGYATFARLNEWHWDLVKIDRDIVAATTTPQRRLLAHVCELLHDLQFNVLAEGIEDDAQWDFAAELGVDWIQGWAASRPLDVEVLLDQLRVDPHFPAR